MSPFLRPVNSFGSKMLRSFEDLFLIPEASFPLICLLDGPRPQHCFSCWASPLCLGLRPFDSSCLGGFNSWLPQNTLYLAPISWRSALLNFPEKKMLALCMYACMHVCKWFMGSCLFFGLWCLPAEVLSCPSLSLRVFFFIDCAFTFFPKFFLSCDHSSHILKSFLSRDPIYFPNVSIA